MAVAFRALSAVVEIIRPDVSVRSLPLRDLHVLPGDAPQIETTLAPGELITAAILPKPVGGIHRYLKLRDRAPYAFANISIALVAHFEGTTLSAVRIAFGGLAPKPWCVEAAETGIPSAVNPVDPIADIALTGARPNQQNAFKLPLARRALSVFLAEARSDAERRG